MSFSGVVQFWIPTAVLCAVIVVLVRRKQRVRGFLRPSSLLAMSGVALLNAVTVWLVGLSRTGLDLRESCEHENGVRFDEQWNDAHYAESQKLFPLHARCNAEVDLVPAWINPTIIALVLLTAAFLCTAIYQGRKRTHV